MHGSADPAVPLVQSERLQEALRDARVERKFRVLDGAGHCSREFRSPETKRLVREFAESTAVAPPGGMGSTSRQLSLTRFYPSILM